MKVVNIYNKYSGDCSRLHLVIVRNKKKTKELGVGVTES